jgi:hypothetical protein
MMMKLPRASILPANLSFQPAALQTFQPRAPLARRLSEILGSAAVCALHSLPPRLMSV